MSECECECERVCVCVCVQCCFHLHSLLYNITMPVKQILFVASTHACVRVCALIRCFCVG